jgi:site-specific recombinase XerD
MAEEWLRLKRVKERSDDKGNSDRARRQDLVRWGAAYARLAGAPADDDTKAVTVWSRVTADHLADPERLIEILVEFRGQLADSTRQRLLSHLRGWVRWLVSKGVLTVDVTLAEGVGVPTVDQHLDGRTFTDAEIDALKRVLSVDRPKTRTTWPARDVAIVDMLAGCGLRVEELCVLKLSSIAVRASGPFVKVTEAKGGKRREVPIPVETMTTMRSLDAYRAERAARAAILNHIAPPPSAPLFVQVNGRPMNQSIIDHLLRRACLEAGVPAPAGAMAHALRHSFGARLALAGVPVPVIQQLMGHADPRTTTIYMRAVGADVVKALAAAGIT